MVTDEWPPINDVTGSTEEGFLIDVAGKMFEQQNIQVVYPLLPWRRAVDLPRTGRTNGLVGASQTDAPGFIFPSEELSRKVIAFYVRTQRGHRRFAAQRPPGGDPVQIGFEGLEVEIHRDAARRPAPGLPFQHVKPKAVRS